MFAVNASLIRFWHKEFDQFLKPKINKKGNRLFTPKDIVNFSKIHFFVKEKGYTLEGAKKAMKEKEAVETTNHSSESTLKSVKEEVIQRLEAIKKKLLQLNN